MLSCFFFFSSRRRHTRLQGDWSSDVCSSDLRAIGLPALAVRAAAPVACMPPAPDRTGAATRPGPGTGRRRDNPPESRSEERRVGKECRAGWWAWQEGTAEEKIDGGEGQR